MPYADELAALYSAYRRRLEALERPDREGEAWAALDALRADPAAWGRRPVFLYGFDELTRAQLDAVETLSRLCEADVWVTLPYEPGRHALAGSAATVHELAPLGEVVELPERAEHYAGAARPALHHLERGLFEAGAERRAPNGAVRLLEAGGERAEAEIVGAEVLELMRDGVAAEDIAVLVRGSGTAALFAQVLGTYGIPVAWSRRVPLARTRLGAGVLAGARAALPGGRAEDLLTWLRTPGGMDGGAAPTPSMRSTRGCGAHEVADAREAAAQAGGVGAAAARRPRRRRGGRARRRCSRRSWPRPTRRGRRRTRAAPTCSPPRSATRRGSRRSCAPPRASCARSTRSCSASPSELLDALGAVEVRQGDDTDGVLLADPLDIRARRFRAVFVCGLQDGEFPQRPGARAVPRRRGAAGAERRGGAAAAVPRGRARPRALAVLRLRLAPAGGAVPVLALVGRGGRAAGRLAVPRRRRGRCSPTSCGSSAAGGCWPR